jgi:hypothetical protein
MFGESRKASIDARTVGPPTVRVPGARRRDASFVTLAAITEPLSRSTYRITCTSRAPIGAGTVLVTGSHCGSAYRIMVCYPVAVAAEQPPTHFT